jgi:hypothetical protein
MLQEWHEAQASSAEQARALALKQFGRQLAAAEQVRAVHLHQWLESLLQDVRDADCGFRKRPGFTLVGCITIAAGVGASTAVFSVIDPLLFRHGSRKLDLRTLGYRTTRFSIQHTQPATS